jgi:uncharacterized protein with HEPN domain
MPKRIVDLFVLDIIISVDRIKRFSSKLNSSEDLIKNEEVCSAILRELGIIGEAMNKILQVKKITSFIKPSWRDIVDFRNIVIHEYFGLNFDEIYKIIKKEIPTLEKEVIILIKNLWQEKSMQQALDDTLKELKFMCRNTSFKYLENLKKNLNK